MTRLSLHLDLDVHDPALVAPANTIAEPDGLSAEEVLATIRSAATAAPIVAASLSSYEPRCDVDDRMLNAALGAIVVVAEVGT